MHWSGLKAGLLPLAASERSVPTKVECESHSSREFGTRCLLNLLEKYEGAGNPALQGVGVPESADLTSRFRSGYWRNSASRSFRQREC